MEKRKNQIDYILINARHAKDIMDVRSRIRADSNSDHFLVRIKFKPKISVPGIRSGKKFER
jgi:endonuclease/exonuclease/phosphatase family metal-dependent hydrolase